MMESTTDASRPAAHHKRGGSPPARLGGRRLFSITAGTLLIMAILTASVAWLGMQASILRSELESAARLLPQLENDILRNEVAAAEATLAQMKSHTTSARQAGADPLWTAAQLIPWVGSNFQAVTEVATSADDLVAFGASPVVSAFQSLDWQLLVSSGGRFDPAPLADAQPKLESAAHALRQSSDRLKSIDVNGLLPQVAGPLLRVQEQLESLRGGLDAAAAASSVAPSMLGTHGQRNYLLMIQNNAEARASGGIPGALAVLTLDNGKLTLGAQSSAGEVGIMSPAIAVDEEQTQIYTTRIGKFMQDVNLTPDFPTAAATAQAMWEKSTGQRVDGVISMDPVALGYVLDATGPVELTDPGLLALTSSGLPSQLSGKNVVPTLLSDVYAKIASPTYQDVYFAGVAKEIFNALSSGKGDASGLINGISRGASEGRILLWSAETQEQSVIAEYRLSGSIAGPSVAPAQFGVYFNDGTGAKMDYHVKRTVQLVKKCAVDGYEETTVRITSTNTAPADAATSLPLYVTGAGAFGVPAGTVRTNVIAYGPVQANVETAAVDGTKTDFAAHRHANRPVGAVAVTLAPGQNSTVELTFGKIVQHTEPNVVVTPTVQPVKDVVLATEIAACNQ